MKILKTHNDTQKGGEFKRLNAYGGCGYYRCVAIAEQLKPEHDVTVWGNEWLEKFEELGRNEDRFYTWIANNFDLVWMHYIDNPRVFAWLRVAITRAGKKLVMDIDDNFLDVEKTNPAYKTIKKGSGKRAELATILASCDALTVSTLPLKERLKEHIKKIHNIDIPIYIIPNYNDVSHYNFKPVEKPEGVVIGYMGGTSHHGDLKIVLPSIKEVMEKYDHVGFQLIGQLTHDQAKKVFKGWSQKLRKRVILLQPSATYLDFPWWMFQQPWDICIAPLEDNAFNKCKSHIKWMEYSQCSMPTIASNVYPYSKDVLGIKTIENGVTGILCEDSEWVEKLSLLIENKDLRLKLAKKAKEYVTKYWQYKDGKKHILDVVKSL